MTQFERLLAEFCLVRYPGVPVEQLPRATEMAAEVERWAKANRPEEWEALERIWDERKVR